LSLSCKHIPALNLDRSSLGFCFYSDRSSRLISRRF
jgi:hypothetical protein